MWHILIGFTDGSISQFDEFCMWYIALYHIWFDGFTWYIFHRTFMQLIVIFYNIISLVIMEHQKLVELYAMIFHYNKTITYFCFTQNILYIIYIYIYIYWIYFIVLCKIKQISIPVYYVCTNCIELCNICVHSILHTAYNILILQNIYDILSFIWEYVKTKYDIIHIDKWYILYI